MALGILGAILSLLFAWATTFIVEYYEIVLVDGMLTGFAEDIAARDVDQPVNPRSLPRTHMLQGYLRLADGSGDVPAAIASFPLGMHEFELGEEFDSRVGVFALGEKRLYFAINLDDVERLEDKLERILGAIVVFGTLIAAWLGWLFAGRTIAPVIWLADAVEALPAHAQQTQLANLVHADELGRLAAAIDSFQDRLIRTEARERVFFADASHELRTPLAVVRGVVELLLDDEQVLKHSRKRLERLDRGMSSLADLLEVLLNLARGKHSSIEWSNSAEWLHEALSGDSLQSSVDIRVEDGAERIAICPREAGLVIRGMLRRIKRSGSSTRAEVRVGRGSIVLSTALAHSVSLESAPGRKSGDTGLGATLVGRLAARMGWLINESLLAEGQVTINMPETDQVFPSSDSEEAVRTAV